MCQRPGANVPQLVTPALEQAPPDRLGLLAREVADLQQRVEQDLGHMRAQLDSVRASAGEPAALVAHAGAAFAGLMRDVEPAASVGPIAQQLVCWEPHEVSGYLRTAWRVDADRARGLQEAWRDAGLIRVDGAGAITSVLALGGARSELVCVTPETYQQYRQQLDPNGATDDQSADPQDADLRHNAQELSRAYEALRASEQRFRSVAESANDAIVSADGKGDIISWNKGAQAIFGYDEAAVLGKPLTLVIPERFRSAMRRASNG
jgi:PAS domain-containing protein